MNQGALNGMLLWLAHDTTRYWVAAWAAVLLLGAAVYSQLRKETAEPPPPVSRRTDVSVLFFFWLIALFAFRWPLFFHYYPLNPDEAQFVAGGLTLYYDPVFWRSLDGTTLGPLIYYPLTLLKLLGAPLTLFTARILSIFLLTVMFSFGYLTLRLSFSPGRSFFALTPGMLWYAMSTYYDYGGYTSELSPIALLSIAFYLLMRFARDMQAGDVAPPRLLGGCFLLGWLPYAKLQSAPIGVVVFGYFFILLLMARTMPLQQRVKLAAASFLAGAAPSVCVLCFVLFHGLWGEFWQSYILNNLMYTGQSYFNTKFMFPKGEWTPFVEFLFGRPATWAWFWGPMIFLGMVTGGLRIARKGGRREYLPLFLFFTASVLCTLAPRRFFEHYRFFLVLPLSLLVGTLFLDMTRYYHEKKRTGAVAALFVLFILAGWCAQMGARGWEENRALADLETRIRTKAQYFTAYYAHQYVKPDDRMTVWGWMPEHYVYAQMPMGTRDVHTLHQIEPHGMQDFYIKRFLNDFYQSKPAVFIDAVGESGFFLKDRAKYGHETLPKLKEWIENHYRLVVEARGQRVYIRADRYEEKKRRDAAAGS